MKEVKEIKNPLRCDEIISPDNIMRIGERIACKALKTVLLHGYNRRLNKLYMDLVKDMVSVNNPEHIFSEGYDLAQEAACFLCEYMGKPLNEVCAYDVKGRITTILRACFSRVNHLITIEKKDSYVITNPECPEVINLSVEFEATIAVEEDYTAVDEIIERMKLTPLQSKTLEYLMNGMSLMHIAEMYNVMVSSIWFRCGAIQKKYYKYIEV